MKGVVVLGSTGSIGTQTLDVISQFPDRLRVVGLAARANEPLLRDQAARFGVGHTALVDRDGIEAASALAELPEADIVVIAVAGVIGLRPTLAAIRAGKHIALASKEVLVAAGEVVMPLVREHGVTLTPIDSEHSAIFQCVQGYRPDQIDRLILTASGGPFRGWTRGALAAVSVEQALNHPTWRMGGKITIDSATLMNKALEMIEAKWLFGMDIDRIDVVVHPQSIVHSMVRLTDGSVLGQLGWPDMRLPIAYALLFPERLPNDLRPWNPWATPNLTFERVDEETFPALRLARSAAIAGGTAPCRFNAANEEAANAFLNGKIRFLQIADFVESTLSAHPNEPATLENIVHADASARESVRSLMLSI
jgi:1-deoxy-D-xylulose-5-phosphate reductoisomerase